MHVAKPDVARVGYLDRPREGLKRANDAVHVEVGDANVAGGGDLQRQVKPAFAALRFRLQGVETPVSGVADLDLVVDVMLARHLVNAASGLGVRDEHAGLSERRGGPNIQKRAAASIGDPKAGVLTVPAAIGIGVGRMVAVVGVFA